MKKILILLCFALVIEADILNRDSIVHPAVSNSGMVVSQHYLATEVGKTILDQGGNAIDASVAVAFALAVVLPRAGNIGGGGFLVLHNAEENKNYALDYREMAPAAANRDMYLNEDGSVNKSTSRLGYLASGIPGTVAGMWEAHQKFGSMPWKDLLKPAIQLAQAGFKVSPFMADSINRAHSSMKDYPSTVKIFFPEFPLKPHHNLVQKDLAATLKRIAQNGRDGFYKGKTAKMIAVAMKKNNGLITEDDLKNYKTVWRDPLVGNYKDFKIVTMPPPSSGGVHLIQMLNVLSNFNLNSLGHNSRDYILLLTEVMKYAYADRSKYLGDPDFYEVPVSELTEQAYAASIANSINVGKITSSDEISPGAMLPPEGMETTHFSISDKFGNTVSNTYTINSSYGAKVVVEGLGFLLNNEMDDFAAAPGIPNQFGLLGGEANKIEPYKRPLSSMTPTIVFFQDKPYLITGSPGGSRIITTVLQMILNVIEFEMEVSDATVQPRIHHQWKPDVLGLEKGFNSSIIEQIMQSPQKVYVHSPGTSLESIVLKNSYHYGFGDTRRPDSLAKGSDG
ncbi:MAG: gamma-glutamyltransferase [Proteobacteria bacterium]|nr:gamma-glutamyltransferase [Pseudomonadota bacterium]